MSTSRWCWCVIERRAGEWGPPGASPRAPGSAVPAVPDPEVVHPVLPVPAELPQPINGVPAVREAASEALRELRSVTPYPPGRVIDFREVGAEHAARIEVVHVERFRSRGGWDSTLLRADPISAHPSDDGERIREHRMIGAGADGQELLPPRATR